MNSVLYPEFIFLCDFFLFSRVCLLVNLFSGVSILYFPCEKLQINSYLHFLAPVSILALSYSPLYHLYGTSRDTNFHVLTGYLRRFIVVNNGEKPGVSRCKQKGWSRMLWLQRLGLQRATGSSGRWGWGCGLVALTLAAGTGVVCSVSGFASPHSVSHWDLAAKHSVGPVLTDTATKTMCT